MSNRELLLQRFRELHEYVRLMGEHVNQIHGRLDSIEKNINEITKKQNSSTDSIELENIKEIMVTKSELDGFLQELNSAIKGLLPVLPSLTPELSSKEKVEVQGEKEKVEVQGEKEKVKESQKEPAREVKRRRFPFLSKS